LFASTFLAFSGTTETDEMESDSIRAHLTNVNGAVDMSAGHLSKMSVSVAIDTVQEARLGGIELELEIEYRNDGPDDVELFDPLDQIQYMLLDSAGYPVNTPPYAPRSLTQPWDETVASLENRFSIVSIHENGYEMNVEKEVGRKTITVKSGTSYSVTLRIRKIMDERTPAKAIDIPPGVYGIVLTCTLLTQAHGEVDKRLLQSEQLTVRLQ
jgi:hypothetical protein